MKQIGKRLENKVAIITGAASGIGEASAVLFAREGAKVILADVNEEKGNGVANRILNNGNEALFIKVDVSKQDDINNMVGKAIEKFDVIDVLFNNAGIARLKPLHQVDEDEWNQVIDINLKGVYLCSKGVLPYMRKQRKGSIINNSSIAGVVGFPGAAAYCASKGGLGLLTRNMALDYAIDGIRVNDICPGVIKTPMTLDEETMGEKQIEEMEKVHPLGRAGKPEEVAYTALFLASDESSFITGSSIMVDGGYTAK